MIKTTNIIPDFPDFHTFYEYSPAQTLFFDIETTGLSPKNSVVFLIGTIHQENNHWILTQYMLEHAQEEAQLLSAFFEDIKSFSFLIHFNGSSFDLPYLKKKADSYQIPSFPESIVSIDLYQRLRALRQLPQMDRMNQISLEQLAGWSRTDTLTGKHMIALFRSFDKTQDPELLRLMMLHNHDDLLGMTHLLPLASYLLFFDGQIASVASCRREEGSASPTLVIQFTLTEPLPQPLAVSFPASQSDTTASDCFFNLEAESSSATLRLTGFSEELKYFFPDYKNYYYLPLEDQAMHKSVASYIDREYRIPAKPSTCYTRKSDCFYWQPSALLQPAFYRSFGEKDCWFSYQEMYTANPALLLPFLQSLLRICFS